ncbi:hypothetical protein GCM10007890_53190 [Methylobacterium tardum]|uniref:Uncharacterized protein n=1 Tax=Methylobacterium tardum TaxID=374432 RepID=A0AA37TG36_9HYPH|nr:hypothetical protein GCM10007890_53190 [Methylobacterium tardum]
MVENAHQKGRLPGALPERLGAESARCQERQEAVILGRDPQKNVQGEPFGGFIPLKRFAIHQHVNATKATEGLHCPLIMIGAHRDNGS